MIAQAALLLCALAVIWGGIGVYLRQEWQRAQHDAEHQTANLARAFEQTVSRSIAVLDQALEHVRDLYLRDPEHFKLDGWMRDKLILNEIGVQLAIADATGLITASTASAAANVNIADREHFKVHESSARDLLFISKPVIGRVSGGLSIQLSREMKTADGHFAGVVVASLHPDVLGVFRGSSGVSEGFTMLTGRDGIIRAAHPDPSMVGKSVVPDPGMAHLPGEVAYRYDNNITVNPEAIVSNREVSNYPLFVSVGIPRHVAFASYNRARRNTVLAGGFLSAIVLVVGLTTITQLRRLNHFHRALALTVENISQGVMMIDPRRRIPVINHRVAELLGVPVELARPGARFDTLKEWQRRHGEFQPEPTGGPIIAGLISKGSIDPGMAFYERTRADGTVLEVRTAALPDGSAVRTYTDVTERKRIERELGAARDAAEAGIRARTEFLAVMGHEFRTPVNGIIGAAGLLSDMRLNEEQLAYVRIISESSDHLSSLIQDILDFSRLDAGLLQLDEIAFDPSALVQGTIAMLEGQARARGLNLTATVGEGVPDRLVGDASRLGQILVNLIGNAIKFTEAGSVTVAVRAIAANEQTVTIGIAIADTGIGIDPDSKQKLFSAFTQVDSSISRRFGGTGLGLAICKHLVTLLGGTIGVDSTSGQGSTFSFTAVLRRVAAEAPTETTSPEASNSGRRLKVLLAEDNPVNRHVATSMLIRMGHQVDAVADGAQAVASVAAGDYDVVLMDLMMPEVDGLTATRAIRAGVPPRCRTVIIGLTANALPSDREACEEAGMNDFVPKPVTLERLRAVLQRSAAPAFMATEPLIAADAVTMDYEALHQLADQIGMPGVVEMLRIFLEDAPIHMVAIEHAMRHGAIQTIRREAHALAGAARTIGFPKLGQSAATLQRACEGSGPGAGEIETMADLLRQSLLLASAWADAHEPVDASGA